MLFTYYCADIKRSKSASQGQYTKGHIIAKNKRKENTMHDRNT